MPLVGTLGLRFKKILLLARFTFGPNNDKMSFQLIIMFMKRTLPINRSEALVWVCICMCVCVCVCVYALVSLDHYKGALFFVAVMVMFMWGKGEVGHTGRGCLFLWVGF